MTTNNVFARAERELRALLADVAVSMYLLIVSNNHDPSTRQACSGSSFGAAANVVPALNQLGPLHRGAKRQYCGGNMRRRQMRKVRAIAAAHSFIDCVV